MSTSGHGPVKAKDLAARAEQLPLLPAVVMRVLTLDPGSEHYFEGLVALAQEDPTFAVRLVRLANAPASAPAKPILTVRQAVVRLGARECAGLVTALAVSRVFIPKTAAQRNLWVHALQVAVAARTIAGLTVGGQVPPDQAYLAGLLHDIGRFVMFEGATEDLSRVDETHWQTPGQLLAAEHDLLGYDHVFLGTLACRRWSMPEAILEVVQLHHDYVLKAPAPKAASAELIRIVQMADLLSVVLMADPAVGDQEPATMAPGLTGHCVRPEWPRAPIAPTVLAQRVKVIRDEAATLVGGLLGGGSTTH